MSKNTPSSSLLTILVIVFLAILTVGYIFYNSRSEGTQPVACTLDAKICPDGTAVGRVGPNCEFAPCPGEVR